MAGIPRKKQGIQGFIPPPPPEAMAPSAVQQGIPTPAPFDMAQGIPSRGAVNGGVMLPPPPMQSMTPPDATMAQQGIGIPQVPQMDQSVQQAAPQPAAAQQQDQQVMSPFETKALSMLKPDPKDNERRDKIAGQITDLLANGGMTKDEQRQHKALSFFEDFVAPAVAAFGGPAGGAAGVQLMQMAHGEGERLKTQRQAETSTRLQGLKLMNDLYDKGGSEAFKQVALLSTLQKNRDNAEHNRTKDETAKERAKGYLDDIASKIGLRKAQGGYLDQKGNLVDEQTLEAHLKNQYMPETLQANIDSKNAGTGLATAKTETENQNRGNVLSLTKNKSTATLQNADSARMTAEAAKKNADNNVNPESPKVAKTKAETAKIEQETQTGAATAAKKLAELRQSFDRDKEDTGKTDEQLYQMPEYKPLQEAHQKAVNLTGVINDFIQKNGRKPSRDEVHALLGQGAH